MPSHPNNIYTISPTVSFADSLAKGLIEKIGDEPEKLPSYLILLPTRRACRNIQEAFLRQSNGKPIMLPRLHPIGDIDEEELFISGNTYGINSIPPAMPPIKRQILLSQLVSKLSPFSNNPEQHIRLATTLGQLMDQIYTENLDLADLPQIVDRETFADHWQVTLDFLAILSTHWPKILKEEGVIDAADRRNRLINALNNYWEEKPPKTPVIAAGTTGSIPATTALLKTISKLSHGSIILPGLDQNMTTQAWDMIEEGHPQSTLKELLENLDCNRHDVKEWNSKKNNPSKEREHFISHAMAPAEYTNEWQKVTLSPQQKEDLKTSLQKVQYVDCASPQEEAQTIALLLREALLEKNKTAALITPNRDLAKRVTIACRRWGIEINDSGGRPLSETPIGIYLKLILQTAISKASPLSLLTLLKHDLCKGAGFPHFRSAVRDLDLHLMRGCLSQTGFDALHIHYQKKMNDDRVKNKPPKELLAIINHLDSALKPLLDFLEKKKQPFSIILKKHLEIAEKFSFSTKGDNASNLWQGDDGEAAAILLSDLQNYTKALPDCTASDYLAILDHFMKTVSVRPKYGTHPRLMILGQLEARLIQADRIIMAGLNEGSWPPDPGHDPWMSRPMRRNFGLPDPERAITLAAHDFAQGFCGKEVFLTRATRENGTPTVPARWLQRIDTFLKAIDLSPDILRNNSYKNYIDLLDEANETKAIERPAPTPPAYSRPDHLSVTKIETWMKDPYSIYAHSILKLNALEPIEKEISAMERGNILHDSLENFTKKYPKNIPEKAKEDFIQITRNALEQEGFDPLEWNFWIPRMNRLSDWLIPHEQQWRKCAAFGQSEIKGKITITQGLEKPFTLTARADRIDYMNTEEAAIIDYKSGGTYSKSKIERGDLPQLPLEAFMLAQGGFEKSGIHQKTIGSISYWKMTGGNPAGEIISIEKTEKLADIIQKTQAGITNLIHIFEKDETPYIALPRLDNVPRFNDYEHLERVKEWAALDEGSEEAA